MQGLVSSVSQFLLFETAWQLLGKWVPGAGGEWWDSSFHSTQRGRLPWECIWVHLIQPLSNFLYKV